MISRGEVALIVASKGAALGLMANLFWTGGYHGRCDHDSDSDFIKISL